MTEQSARWRTAITDARSRELRIRGYNLTDLMQHSTFGAVMYLLLRGELPSANHERMMNTLLITVCDHGIAPSEAVTRVVAACGVPMQASVAAGLLTFGDVHGGAGQEFARLIQAWVEDARSQGLGLAEYADRLVAARRKEKKRIDGYGHPLHPEGDPRVAKLRELGAQWQVSGDHVAMADDIERAIFRATGRPIPLNIDGIIAALVSDMGFDWRLARAFVFISRTIGLTAHAYEEMAREPGWRVVATDDEVVYDGPAPRSLPATAAESRVR